MEAIQKYLHDHEGEGDDNLNEDRIMELKTMVTKWTDLSDQARRFARMARSYNQLRKEYETKILEFMKEHEIEQLNTRGAMIQCVSKQRRTRVSREQVASAIPDAEVRQRVLQALDGAGKEHVRLRRINLSMGSE